MASTGKGKRKVKGKTLDLSSFLGDQNAPSGFAVVTPKRDWADYVEEENDDKYPSTRKEEKIVLPTAPKAARGPDFDISRIPTMPPFTAFVGNLPYDITEEEIMRFFGNLKVKSVRLPRDGGDRGRMKGFGYAEFEDRQSLIEALSLNSETLKNRPIKVSLAGESENDRGERRNDGVDRTAGDWRAAPREDDSFSSRNARNGTYSSRYDDSDRDSFRSRNTYSDDRNRNFGGDRQPYQGRQSSERDRDYGFGSDRDRDRGYNRKYGESGFDSYDRSRGFDRSGRGDEKDFGFRRDDERTRGFERSSRGDNRDEPEFRREEREKDPPRERTKLQLKPRTVPVENKDTAVPVQSSIFGGAKPVDTTAKEREIEKRLAKEKEKLDDVEKPRFPDRSSRYPDEKSSKKTDFTKKYDEPLKEKNRSRENGIAITAKEPSKSKLAGADLSSEQENDGLNTFLANKFAHLSNQDMDD